MNTIPNVAVFGEALFDMIQQPNNSFLPFIGGSPYNVARSFVRQGLACTYLSPISTAKAWLIWMLHQTHC